MPQVGLAFWHETVYEQENAEADDPGNHPKCQLTQTEALQEGLPGDAQVPTGKQLNGRTNGSSDQEKDEHYKSHPQIP
jgi:hypothetical protein